MLPGNGFCRRAPKRLSRIHAHMHTFIHIYIYIYIHIHIYIYILGGKNPPKWQKNDLVSGGHGRAAKLGACVNWVDWLCTSADKQMWSGRRTVVMRTGRRAELLGVKLGFPRSRCRAVVSDVLCVRSYVHVCVRVYMCMCVCVRT